MPCRLVPALLDVVVEVLQLSDTSAYYRELSDEEEAAVGAVVAASRDSGRSPSSTWSLPAELQQLGEAMWWLSGCVLALSPMAACRPRYSGQVRHSGACQVDDILFGTLCSLTLKLWCEAAGQLNAHRQHWGQW